MKKGRSETNPTKIKLVDELASKMKEYPIIGLANLYKMPSASLLKIKQGLRGRAEIKVAKKILIERAFKKVDKKSFLEILGGQPALIFSKESPFKLYKYIDRNKSQMAAKVGDIAPDDIVVSAGPTSIPPGPAISTLAKIKIKAKVEGGKLAVINDVKVAKKGDVITQDLATVLNMLAIKPIWIGLDVLAIEEKGIMYLKNVLSIDDVKVTADLIAAVQHALNLSVEACYYTKDNIEIILQKASREANALNKEAKLGGN